MTAPLLDLAAALVGAGLGPTLDLAVERFPRHEPVEADELVPVGAGPAPALGRTPLTTRRDGCTHECRRPVPQRRLVISGLAAGLFAAVADQLGLTWPLLPALVLVAALIPLAFCDAEHLLLPRRLVWMGTAAVGGAVVLASAGMDDWHRLVTAAVASAGFGALLAAISLINPNWLAFGDSRLAVMIGVGIGWLGFGPMIGAMLLANVSAGLGGLVVVATGRHNRIKALPFGVFLTAGAAATLLIHGWG